ncbi:hypothetical protein [Vulcanisaeta sp. JCM 16161]|uniref:hypothetical protein n=1 Tax=Vulcanisaeta sp. JCM 16161 TaxID=1295372 RepID=UPI001FB4025D|nr:hypothetical protein [Vulcanisaeta sp. JCM 16161]
MEGLRLLFSRPSSIMINIITAPLWLAFFILTLRGFGVLTLGKFILQLFLWAAYAFAYTQVGCGVLVVALLRRVMRVFSRMSWPQ